jgi:excisionase family DNA binding protein
VNLTPQDLWSLRNIVIRAVNECHEVLAAAARTAQSERRSHEGRGRPGGEQPAARAGAAGTAQGGPGSKASSPVAVQKLSYSIKEAAAAIGVSTGTIWKLIRAGDLWTFKLGARTLMKAEVLQAFLDKAQREPT